LYQELNNVNTFGSPVSPALAIVRKPPDCEFSINKKDHLPKIDEILGKAVFFCLTQIWASLDKSKWSE